MTEILIVGTGALACLFAARLAASGVSVTMLGGWKEGLAALRNYGVTLVQPDGSQTSYPVRVVDESTDCIPAKLALVLVKSWQTEKAARQLENCLDENGLSLTLQNGLGNREILSSVLGPKRVAQGVTTTGATLLSSGRVRPGGEGVVSIGESQDIRPLAKMLKTADFEVEVVDDLDTLVWSKLIVNAAINPLTALLKITNGEILTRPAARRLSIQLAEEVSAVAAAKGISLPLQDPAALAEKVASATASNRSSMYQDILRGAPTEIDAICGEVVKAGEELGIPTPVNAVMGQLIHALVDPPESR